MRSRGLEFHKGRHRRERRIARAPYFLGRRPMMTSSMSSGRLQMKSRLAGCGFGSSRLRLLAASPSVSTGGDAVVHLCWCVLCAGLLGVRECVLLCMPLRSGELCTSASFTQKKCALNLLVCGVLPRVVSTLFTSPRVKWASSLLIFTHCHMGQRTKIQNMS